MSNLSDLRALQTPAAVLTIGAGGHSNGPTLTGGKFLIQYPSVLTYDNAFPTVGVGASAQYDDSALITVEGEGGSIGNGGYGIPGNAINYNPADYPGATGSSISSVLGGTTGNSGSSVDYNDTGADGVATADYTSKTAVTANIYGGGGGSGGSSGSQPGGSATLNAKLGSNTALTVSINSGPGSTGNGGNATVNLIGAFDHLALAGSLTGDSSLNSSTPSLNCHSVTTLTTVSGYLALGYQAVADFYGCALNQASVDAIIQNIHDQGGNWEGCYIGVNGGTNSAPSSAVASAIADFTSAGGTVVTN